MRVTLENFQHEKKEKFLYIWVINVDDIFKDIVFHSK